MKVKVGYQGMEGSNSEQASKLMMEKLNIETYELVPLVSSFNVINALKRKEVDYAVVATKNSVGGVVKETFDAIKNEDLEQICTEILLIKHSLFKYSAEISNNEITKVISHEQALKQCKHNIAGHFPNAEVIPIEDTAIGAKYLAEGEYDEQTAVICSESAGLHFNLHKEFDAFQDAQDNRTEFRMFKLYEQDDFVEHKPSLKDTIIYNLVNDDGIGFLTKAIIFITIVSSLYIKDMMSEWSNVDAAWAIGGIVSFIVLFLTSKKLQRWFQYNTIKGYWKYYSIPEDGEGDVEQRYETPRVVIIDEVDGELEIKGWLCDFSSVPLFEATKTLTSSFGKETGTLIYWYNTPNQTAREFKLNGIVTMNWKQKYPANKITRMSGWYMGKSTKDIGSIEYRRITKKEFYALKDSDYL